MASNSTPQDHDRIVMPSLKADGTWDQTPDAEIIGDVDVAKRAAGEQAAVRAASAVDVAVRTNPREAPEFESIEQLSKDQEKAAKSARKDAESKVAKAAK